MEPTAGAGLRWARAFLLAAVASTAGVVAHVSAGGLMPGALALLVLFFMCATVAAFFLGRPASTVRVVVLLVAGQTFIHGMLTALRGHRGDPPVRTTEAAAIPRECLDLAGGAGPRRGSLYDQYDGARSACAGAGEHLQLTVPAPVQHLVADMTGPHAWMALAHLLAAVVVGLWLASGERAVWVLVTLLTTGVRELSRTGLIHGYYALLALVTALMVARRRLSSPVPDAVPLDLSRHRERQLGRSLVRRGPPALLAF